MRIEKLRLVNWMPFKGEHTLELPPLPMAVVAQHKDNPRRSNWAGKTALLEAIDWCLHGQHRKNAEDELIHNGEDFCEVELTLTGPFVVKASRRKGGPTRMLLREEPNGFLTEAEEWHGESALERLQKLLGLTKEDFQTTTTFSQGDTEALVSRTSGKRREVVSRWLDLGTWDRVKALAAQRAQNANTTHAALLLAPPEAPQRTDEEVRALLEKAEADVVQLRGEIEALDARLSRARMVERGSGLEAELETARATVRRLRQQLAALPPLPSEEELAVAREADGRAVDALALANAELESAESLLQDGFDGHCPVMKAACPAVEQVRCASQAATQRLEEANAQYTQRMVDAEETGQRVEELEGTVSTREELKARHDEAVALGQRLKAAIEERQATVLPDEEGLAAEELERDLRHLRDAQVEARSAVQQLKRELTDNTARRKKRGEWEASVEKATHEAGVAMLVVRAAGPLGIPAAMASEGLTVLEERGNALLQGTGLSFTFGWERETQELSPVCLDCAYTYKGKRDKECPQCGAVRGQKRSPELEVLVDDGSGVVEDVRAKSGAARALVASAIRLGAGMMRRERTGSRVAWAQVDEPFGALDAENRETLARVFMAMLGSVGLEQAFIVSHDAALLDALPSRILITREGNSSRIAVEV